MEGEKTGDRESRPRRWQAGGGYCGGDSAINRVPPSSRLCRVGPAILRRMWVASAIAGLFALGLALWIVATWIASPRGSTADPEDTEARDPPGSASRSYLLGFALLLTLATVGLDTATAWSDALGHDYRLAWVVALPATGVLGGLALALTLLARPKPQRRPVAEILLWVVACSAFGVASCFGVAFLG